MNTPLAYFTTHDRRYLSSVLAWEQDNGMSRDTVTIAGDANAVRDLPIGTVLGRALFGAPVVAATQGNGGNGAVTGAALGKAAKLGSYIITCMTAAAGGGRFAIVDPDGLRLADAVVGTAYLSPQVGLTIGAGAKDFVVGDNFVLTVPPGDGRCVPLAPKAVDGTQLADSVLLAPVYADVGADVTAPAVLRLARLVASGLVWPDGMTGADIAAALARLARQVLITGPSA